MSACSKKEVPPRPEGIEGRTLESFYPKNLKHITLKDHDCVYIDEGSGTPVLFLHGFSVNLAVFSDNFPTFSKTRRVVAFDYPGYYLSEKKGGVPYDIPFMADAACELIEKLSLEHVVLVGSSMGGAVAIETARRCPGKISALVLAAPAGFSGRQPFFARMVTVQEKLFSAEKYRAKFLERLILRVDTFFVNKQEPARDALIGQYYLMEERGDFDLWIETLSRMARETLTVDNRGGLPGSPVPICVLWGDADEVLPVEGADIAREAFGNSARIETIPGASHLFFVEMPAIFYERVDVFLKSENL